MRIKGKEMAVTKKETFGVTHRCTVVENQGGSLGVLAKFF
jgi:hypothetical protein